MSNVRRTDKNKFLILLDANGLIFARCNRKLERNGFILRDGILEFLKKLMITYDVAIFSSTSYKNLTTFLSPMPSDIRDRIKFIACRKNVKLDPDFGKNPKVNSFDTVKILTDIWAYPYINSKRKWNLTNTLLVDHEESKVRFNRPSNILVVPEWNPSFSKDRIMSLDDIRGGIDIKIKKLREFHSL